MERKKTGFCACVLPTCGSIHLIRCPTRIHCNYQMRGVCQNEKCVFDHGPLDYTPPTARSRAHVLDNGFRVDRNYVTTSDATLLNKLVEIRDDGRFLLNFPCSLFFYFFNYPDHLMGQMDAILPTLITVVTHPKLSAARTSKFGSHQYVEIDTFETVVVPVFALVVDPAFVGGLADPAAFFTRLAAGVEGHFGGAFFACLRKIVGRPVPPLASHHLLRKNYVPLFPAEFFFALIKAVELFVRFSGAGPASPWVATAHLYISLFEACRTKNLFGAGERAVVHEITKTAARITFIAAFEQLRKEFQ